VNSAKATYKSALAQAGAQAAQVTLAKVTYDRYAALRKANAIGVAKGGPAQDQVGGARPHGRQRTPRIARRLDEIARTQEGCHPVKQPGIAFGNENKRPCFLGVRSATAPGCHGWISGVVHGRFQSARRSLYVIPRSHYG